LRQYFSISLCLLFITFIGIGIGPGGTTINKSEQNSDCEQ
jgi:hypothetical protein